MQFLFVPPLLFGNRRCRLPSQAQGLGRVTVHEHWHFFQPLLLTSRRDQVEGPAVVVQLLSGSTVACRRSRGNNIALAAFAAIAIAIAI